jgi:hypothetical protein
MQAGDLASRHELINLRPADPEQLSDLANAKQAHVIHRVSQA